MKASCSKNSSSSETNVDVVGTWTLYSSGSTPPNSNNATVYTADNYPCLANIKLSFISGGKVEGKYIGTTACVIQAPSGSSSGYGSPGEVTPGTFTQNGTAVTIQTSAGTINCQLSSMSDGRLKLSASNISPTNYTLTSVYYK